MEGRSIHPAIRRAIHRAILPTAVTLLLWGQPHSGRAEDQIDQLIGRIPKHMIREHGYSDFTDPVGKFLDLLAAGAFAKARAIQGDACASWRANRQDSPLTGRFRVWDTELDLDTLCASR